MSFVAKRARLESESDVDIDRLCYMAMGDYTNYQRLCDVLPGELSWGHKSMTDLLEYILNEGNGFYADRLIHVLISHVHFSFACRELYFVQLMLDFARNLRIVSMFFGVVLYGRENVSHWRPRWRQLGLSDDPDCVALLNRLQLPVEMFFQEVETSDVAAVDRRQVFDALIRAELDGRLKMRCVICRADLLTEIDPMHNVFYLTISAARIPVIGYKSMWPRLRYVLEPQTAEKINQLLVAEAARMIRRLAGYTLLKDVRQNEFVVCEKKTAVVLDYLYSWRRLNHVVVWQTATTLQFAALAIIKRALPIYVLHQIIELVWPEHLKHSQASLPSQIAALKVATDSANANAKTFARIN